MFYEVYKVSLENYLKFRENNAEIEYQNIFLPRRSSTYAAGYDFCTLDILIKKAKRKCLTGIKCELDLDKYYSYLLNHHLENKASSLMVQE